MHKKLVREALYDPVFDAQVDFRKIMEAMARPGKIAELTHSHIHPPISLHISSALVAFSLLNGDVSFHCNDLPTEVSQYIKLNTAAKEAIVSEADFILLNGEPVSEVIQQAKLGDIRYPEQSATCIIQVDTITSESEEDATKLTLKGPGIEDTITCFIKGLDRQYLWDLKMQNEAYPLGLDVFCTDKNNKLIGIPRTCQLRWE